MKFSCLSSASRPLWVVSAAIFAAVLSWLPQLLILSPKSSFGDEGIVAQAAWRIVQGELPFRDFFSALTPGAFYWSALILKIVGPTFFSLRLSVLLIMGMVLLGAIWVLDRLDVRSVSGYLMVIFFMTFAGGTWFIASAHWVSLVCCLFSLLLLLQEESSLSRKRLIWAGIAAALAAFSMQHKGAVWILAASVGLLAGRTRDRKYALLWFWAGILAVALPLAAVFIYLAGMAPLIDQLLLFPMTQYHKLEGHKSITIVEDVMRSGRSVHAAWLVSATAAGYYKVAVWSLGYIGRLIIHLLPFAGVAAIVCLWRGKVYSRSHLCLLTAFFLAMFMSALHRIHETTLTFAAPAAVIVIVLQFEAVCKRGCDRMKEALRRVTTALWVGLFGGIIVGYFFLEVATTRFPTQTLAGTVVSRYPDEAQALDGVTKFMHEKMTPGEAVFCYSYNPIFYFLLQAKNPTPFDILVHPLNTQAQLDQAQALLEESRCRWVVWDYTSLWLNPFGQYLSNTYELKARFSNVAIMERRKEAGY